MVDSVGIAQLSGGTGVSPAAPTTTRDIPPAIYSGHAQAQQTVVDQVDLSPQAAQQAEPKIQYANPEVLGTTSFSLYKAEDGELVTRIVDQKTGKVTYIPKEFPSLDGNLGSQGTQPALNITA